MSKQRNNKNIEEIAKDDILGRKLQDARLIIKERAPKTTLRKQRDGNQD